MFYLSLLRAPELGLGQPLVNLFCTPIPVCETGILVRHKLAEHTLGIDAEPGLRHSFLQPSTGFSEADVVKRSISWKNKT